MSIDNVQGNLFVTLHDEAHARIIWGESAEQVTEWLGKQGLTEGQAEALVKSSLAERYLEVRKSGLRMILTGGLMLVVGAAPIVGAFFGITNILDWWLDVAVMLALLGFSRLLTGAWQLFSGRARGAVSDMA
ncbi:MAG: hypothetical protein L3J39_03075 [Verrucomicrobiales bacterium]|nr:hypothetical protein [Verrucomicrobiales bacterium]